MSFWQSKLIKKSRKSHQCEYCLGTIPLASSYYRESGTCDGDLQSYALCIRCHKYIEKRTWESYDDNYLGNFLDDLFECEEVLECPSCGELPISHKEVDWIDSQRLYVRCHCVSESCKGDDAEYLVDLTFGTVG